MPAPATSSAPATGAHVGAGARWITGPRLTAAAVYLVLLVLALLEQAGRVTADTRITVLLQPWEELRNAFTLWNGDLTLGELQNQGYGYLFPMGPFFGLGELLHVPPWVTERVWSVLLLVAGAEGARLLARAVGLSAWPALAAGLAYGVNARVLGQVATRSAEMLPTVALPWMVLPLVLAISGRLRAWPAALLSAGAFVCAGAVNATATLAVLPLPVLLLAWACVTRRTGRSLLAWWAGFVAAASAWWLGALVLLGAYSPPFFDFVEDARVTTATTGWFASLRATTNWVGYLVQGGSPGWPAAYDLVHVSYLVVATAVVGLLGLIGLVSWRSGWRQPFLLSAVLGLVLLTAAQTSSYAGPLAAPLQGWLDGPLAPLRNVSKVDPLVRLPLALGLGAGIGVALAGWGRRRPSREIVRGTVAGLVAVLLVVLVQPAWSLNLRTPGWTAVPDYWTQAAAYLAEAPGADRAWVVPGAGFGVQTWGWTLEEPLAVEAESAWVTRSQAPLAPPETIRVLSRLEDTLATGTGSPHLGRALARLGIGYVVVRHDLDPGLAGSTSSRQVSLALGRSGELRLAARFGPSGLVPQIEIYAVTETAAPEVRVLAEDGALRVASAAADVIDAVARGLLGEDRAGVVVGDLPEDVSQGGPEQPSAAVVGDSFRLRERNFGRVTDAEGPVRAPGEPRQDDRVVPDYPGSPGAVPVYARYYGARALRASSTQADVTALGAVRPEDAPFSAVDGDLATSWRTEAFVRPDREWLEVDLDRPRRLDEVSISQPVEDPDVLRVLRWEVRYGDERSIASVDAFTGVATVDLAGARVDRVRVIALEVEDPLERGPVGIAELDLGVPISRTLVVPDRPLVSRPAFLFSARPETRACIATLLGPDCRAGRARASDEGTGIDRTVTLEDRATFTLTGQVVARSGLAAAALLDPVGDAQVVRTSSIFAGDPQVSGRMLYDADPRTSWIADPRDDTPTLTVVWDEPRTVTRVAVARPAAPGVAPTRAVIRSARETRTVTLDEFGAMEPITARRLEITLLNPTRRDAPIGLGDLRLVGARLAIPFDLSTPTGAVCGLGPEVLVGTERYPTRVNGAMGDVSFAGQLRVELCGSEPIRLPAGEVRVRVASTSQFQPVSVDLVPADPEPSPAATERALDRLEDSAGERFVLGPGEAVLLATTRNANPGWEARLDGELLPAQRVDGWAQGWRVPAGDGGEIVLTFGPQGPYRTVLVVGLGLAGLVLLGALVTLLSRAGRPRGAPLAEPPAPLLNPALHRARRSPSRLVRFVTGQGLLVLGWVVGGLPAVAGLLLAWTARRLRRPVWPAAIALVAAALVVTLVEQPALASPLSDLLAGVGVVAVLASAWRSPFEAGARSSSAVDGGAG